jgi:slit protein 2
LGRNPLVCNCKLKWLNDYFRNKPVEKSGITCSFPKRLAKKSIGSIPDKRFRCHSNVTLFNEYASNEYCGQSECPKECTCQGTIVDCRDKKLTSLPENVPAYTTQLYVLNSIVFFLN